MGGRTHYSAEVRERAVRLVLSQSGAGSRVMRLTALCAVALLCFACSDERSGSSDVAPAGDGGSAVAGEGESEAAPPEDGAGDEGGTGEPREEPGPGEVSEEEGPIGTDDGGAVGEGEGEGAPPVEPPCVEFEVGLGEEHALSPKVASAGAFSTAVVWMAERFEPRRVRLRLGLSDGGGRVLAEAGVGGLAWPELVAMGPLGYAVGWTDQVGGAVVIEVIGPNGELRWRDELEAEPGLASGPWLAWDGQALWAMDRAQGGQRPAGLRRFAGDGAALGVREVTVGFGGSVIHDLAAGADGARVLHSAALNEGMPRISAVDVLGEASDSVTVEIEGAADVIAGALTPDGAAFAVAMALPASARRYGIWAGALGALGADQPTAEVVAADAGWIRTSVSINPHPAGLLVGYTGASEGSGDNDEARLAWLDPAGRPLSDDIVALGPGEATHSYAVTAHWEAGGDYAVVAFTDVRDRREGPGGGLDLLSQLWLDCVPPP